MAGFDKRVSSYEEALAGLKDGMTVIAVASACAAFRKT